MNNEVSHLELSIDILVVLVEYGGVDHSRHTRDSAVQALQIMVECQLMLLLKVYRQMESLKLRDRGRGVVY